MKRKTLLIALLMALFAPLAMNAQETFTVHDNTSTNSYIPFYGYYADYGTRSQFIIPASDLEDLVGATIQQLTFYTSTASTTFDEEVTVYLKEVDYTVFESATLEDWSGMTAVWTGNLVVSDNQLGIEFSSPYTYEGDNLMIGFQVTSWGSSCPGISWYGENQSSGTYTAAYNNANYSHTWNSSISRVAFIPKTTFTYTPGTVDCERPDGIEASNVTHNGAKLTWTGGSGHYNLEYKKAADANWTTAVSNTTALTYNLSGLDGNTEYSARVQSVCTGSTSTYRTVSFTTMNPCASPTNLQVTGITASSATLSWTAGYQETSWTVKYKKSSDTEYMEKSVSGTPSTTLTGLDGLTVYNVRVYNCTGDNDPYLSGNFTTAASFPYSQDFSGGTTIPTGWTQYSGLLADVMAGTASLTSASYGWSNGTLNGVLDGNNIYANIYSTGCKKWIVTPAIPVASNARLTFDVAYTAYSGTAADPDQSGTDDKFVVLASTDNMATWTILYQWDNAGSEYVLNDLTPETLHMVYDLAGYANQNTIIAFYAESTESNTDNNIHVDNVVFELIPSCEKPTNVEVSYTGGTSAVVSWTGDATNYNISVNGTVTNNVTSPYTISNLSLETTYEVMVQTKCSASNLSEWTNPVSFTTDMCMPSDQCELTFELTDSYGDGWNGAYIEVVDVLTGATLATLRNQNLSKAAETETYTLAVCNGREIQFVWHSGSYDSECSFVIYDLNGDEIVSGVNALPYNYTVNCSACRKPTDLTVSDFTGTTATVSWTGEAESYNLRYRKLGAEDFATIIFSPDDVWQDGTGYQLLLDANATAYGTIIPTSGGLTTSGDASAAVYAEFEYKIPANADGAMNTQNVLIGESASIQVPAGIFDWCVTNPTPGDRIWIAGEGRYNDYEFEAGKTYLFVVQSNGDGGDEVVVTVSDDGGAKDAVWTEINNTTSPCSITVEPESDYVVEVQANCGADQSNWVSLNFSTPSTCEVPTPLDVTDITAFTATLNWTGITDSYQVQYRTRGSRELLFFENFDNQPSTWTLTNSVYDRTSSQTTDYLVFLGSGSTETAYVITPELTAFENGGTLEFKQRVYNGEATFQVGFSSTTNDVDAFTWGSEVSAAPTMFTAYSVALPNGTKYVAIKSTTPTETCAVLINDFGIYGNEIPAGPWNTVTVNTTSCPISGLVADTEYEWQVRGVNSSCSGGYTDWCDLVTFTTDVSCPAPTDLTVTEITSESAVVAWTSDADSFDIDVNGVVTNNVKSPYSLTDLDAGTLITVKVRANCGSDNGYSEWVQISFYTECEAFDLPYEYGFDDVLTSDTPDVDCWDWMSANTVNDFGLTYDPDDDSNIVFYFNSYSSADAYDQVLISPALNTTGAVKVEFDYRSHTSGVETFMVGYSATKNLDDFEWFDEISISGGEWTRFEETCPAGTKYVAVYYTSVFKYYLFIDNFKFSVSAGEAQTIELTEGWNWVSLYVENDDPVALLDMLKEALGENAIEIQSYDSNTEFDDGEWFGDLDDTGITNDQMYMILVSADCTVKLEGPVANPADYPITIYPGPNWIGFPYNQEVEINLALSDFEAEENDWIQSRNDMTEFDGDEWFGDIENLIPGEGYVYFSTSDDVKTLYITTAAKIRRAFSEMKARKGQSIKVQKIESNQKKVQPRDVKSRY